MSVSAEVLLGIGMGCSWPLGARAASDGRHRALKVVKIGKRDFTGLAGPNINGYIKSFPDLFANSLLGGPWIIFQSFQESHEAFRRPSL